MTKLQKMQRRKKWYRYFPIIATVPLVILLLFEIFSLIVVPGISEISVILMFILTLMFYVLEKVASEALILEIDRDIENEKVKLEIKGQFDSSDEEYIEIFWNDETDKEKLSKKRLLKRCGAKFYAKFISDDEIEIVVKDKNGEVLDDPEVIDNFVYFREHYKL